MRKLVKNELYFWLAPSTNVLKNVTWKLACKESLDRQDYSVEGKFNVDCGCENWVVTPRGNLSLS